MEKIILKDKEFTIRKFSENDCENPQKFLVYINSLIDDPEALISLKTKKSIKEEKTWLQNTLSIIKSSKMTMLIAESENLIIGETGVRICPERRDHVAELGISITKDYRGYGLGTLLLKKIIQAAKINLMPQPIMIRLSAFDTNKKAISLYEKNGFKVVARIPKQHKFNNRLIDELVMIHYI